MPLMTAYFQPKNSKWALWCKCLIVNCVYSKFPQIPLFGRAAREKHLEELQAKRDEIAEEYAQIAFDVQKMSTFTRTL